MADKKDFPPITNLPAEDEWAISRGENKGKPLLVRVNTSAMSYAGHPDLPVRLGVAIPLRAPDANGLPSQAEGDQINTIEDVLFGAIQGSGTGRVVLILTTSGMREFVSYARSKEAAIAAIRSAGQSVKTHKLQAYTAPDPEWKLFRQFAS